MLEGSIVPPIKVNPDELQFDPIHELEDMMCESPLFDHKSDDPSVHPKGFVFSNEDMHCFEAWEDFDCDDEIEVALTKATEGMSVCEAAIIKEKMRRMRALDDRWMRDMEVMNSLALPIA